MEPVVLARASHIVKLHPAWEDWHLGNIAPAGPELIYSHAVELQDDKGFSYGVMGGTDINDPFAMHSTYQALILPKGGYLSSIKLWVRAQTGNFDVVVQVQAATGAAGSMEPTGPILATSNPILNSALNRVDGSLQEFIFSGANQINLQAGQPYAFIFTYAGAVYPPQGEWIYIGLQWVGSLPNNIGFYQGGWSADNGGTATMYLYTGPPPPPAPPATLLDSWDPSNQNDISSYQIGSGSNSNWPVGVGQAFTASQSGKLSSVKFSLKRYGNPTFDLVAQLYAASGAFPMAGAVGPPLAVSAPINAATISDTAAQGDVAAMYEFLFSGANQFQVVSGTNYVIMVWANAAYSAVDKIGVGVDFDFGGDPNPGHGGNYSGLNVVSGPAIDDLADTIFELYVIP